MTPLKTAFIGTGNVAWTLVPALVASPAVEVRWIVARNGATLPVENAPIALTTPAEIPLDADLIIISVKDDSVSQVVKALGPRKAIIAHTSGSVPMPAHTSGNEFGVFYPLQTFSKGHTVGLRDVPFLIEGSTPRVMQVLSAVAQSLDGRPVEADSAQRRRIHLAAVFACNFVNNMWATAEDVLAADGEDLRLLAPLLRETLEKALTAGADRAQTGPACRGDVEVEKAHLAMLDGDAAEMYTMITRSIAKRYEQNSI